MEADQIGSEHLGQVARLAKHQNIYTRTATTSLWRSKMMSEIVNQVLLIVYLARDRETAWTLFGATDRTYRPAAHRTGRVQCALAGGTVAWIELWRGIYQAVATCQAHLRASWLWNCRGNRPRFSRMELWRLRGSPHRRDPG